jgi:hypothetical protein
MFHRELPGNHQILQAPLGAPRPTVLGDLCNLVLLILSSR